MAIIHWMEINLISMYRKNPEGEEEKELNKKILTIYKKWYDSDFSFDSNQKVASMLLMGSSGQDKSTTFKVAAKRVSDALDLNFVINPEDTYKSTKNDFLFVSLNCSDEESANLLQQENILNNLSSLGACAGSVLMLSDVLNSSPRNQNIILSMTDEKRFKGVVLENIYFGLTSNLTLDSEENAKLPAALRRRYVNIFVKDELTNLDARILNTHKNDAQTQKIKLN